MTRLSLLDELSGLLQSNYKVSKGTESTAVLAAFLLGVNCLIRAPPVLGALL